MSSKRLLALLLLCGAVAAAEGFVRAFGKLFVDEGCKEVSFVGANTWRMLEAQAGLYGVQACGAAAGRRAPAAAAPPRYLRTTAPGPPAGERQEPRHCAAGQRRRAQHICVARLCDRHRARAAAPDRARWVGTAAVAQGMPSAARAASSPAPLPSCRSHPHPPPPYTNRRVQRCRPEGPGSRPWPTPPRAGCASSSSWPETGAAPNARIQYASWNGRSSPDDFYASPAVRATFRDHLAFMVRGMVGVQGPMSRCAQRPGAPCLLASPSCHSAGQPHKHGQRPQVPASGAGRGRAGEQAAGSGLRLAVGDSATLATPTPQPAVGSASRHRLPPSPHHRTPCCSDDPTIFSWNLMNEPRFFANTSSNPCDTDPASCTATLQVGGGGNRGLRSCRCCLQGDCTP